MRRDDDAGWWWCEGTLDNDRLGRRPKDHVAREGDHRQKQDHIPLHVTPCLQFRRLTGENQGKDHKRHFRLPTQPLKHATFPANNIGIDAK